MPEWTLLCFVLLGIGATAIFTGSPPPRGSVVSERTAPLAIYAIIPLAPPRAARIRLEPDGRTPTRVVEPLERPPRA